VNIHEPLSNYFVIVTRKGRRRVWQWQIQRRPPSGIRLYGTGFKTEFDARLAGEKALQALASQKTLQNNRPGRIAANIAKLPELLRK
jgi:hypothetical protein